MDLQISNTEGKLSPQAKGNAGSQFEIGGSETGQSGTKTGPAITALRFQTGLVPS